MLIAKVILPASPSDIPPNTVEALLELHIWLWQSQKLSTEQNTAISETWCIYTHAEKTTSFIPRNDELLTMCRHAIDLFSGQSYHIG